MPSLTGLRGIAAFAVMLAHAEVFGPAREVQTQHFFRGQPFVDIFFVLSGFVISYVYLRPGAHLRWKSFALARFARIYPLHVATSLFAAAALVTRDLLADRGWPEHVDMAHLVRELSLTMAMPGTWLSSIWNFPAWSISVEWWTYFTAVPLIVHVGRRLPVRIAAALVGLGLIALVITLYGFSDEGRITRGTLAFLRAALEFSAGWVVFRASMAPDRWTPPAWFTTAVFGGIGVLIYGVPLATGTEAWFCLLLYPVLIYMLSIDGHSTASRILSCRPIVYLGTVSYSIYLLHGIVLNGLKVVLPTFPMLRHEPVWTLAIVAVTIPAAAGSYALLECPARDFIRRRLAQPARPLVSDDAPAPVA